MNRRFHRVLFVGLCGLLASGCIPGGIFQRGGRVHSVSMAAEATLTRGADFQYVCIDDEEIRRRESLSEEELANLGPPVRLVDPAQGDPRCFTEGETSVFFLFNLWPATPPLDPEYAIATAVQALEGDTMIRLRLWHETHYYSLLGRVEVMRVRGMVIKFDSVDEETE